MYVACVGANEQYSNRNKQSPDAAVFCALL